MLLKQGATYAPLPMQSKISKNSRNLFKFIMEFKNLVQSDCFDRMDAENHERAKIKSIVREQMMEDG